MIDLIYKALADKLAAITNESGDYIFEHIDLWNQNVEFLEQEQPWATPACFIEITPIPWEQLRESAQQADISIRLHLVTRWEAPTTHNGKHTARGVKYLNLSDYVFGALHDRNCDYLGVIQRVGSEPNHNHAEVIDNVEIYQGRVFIQVTKNWAEKEVEAEIIEA